MPKKIPAYRPSRSPQQGTVQRLKKELAEARVQLTRSQSLLRSLLDHNPDGVVVVDSKGMIRMINPAGEFLLDHEKGEFVGGLLDFSLVLGGKTEIPLVDKNGQGRVAEIKVVKTLWQEDGKEESVFFATLRDITERKRYEEELKKLSQLKTDFVSMASHELKTPLTVLRESISQVTEGYHGVLTEASKEVLGISLRAVERLSRLIEDLLDISKMEAGKIVLNRELIDMVTVAKEAVASFAPRARKKGLEIRESYARETVKVYADRDRVIQIFTNLIGNALKFTERGFIEIGVSEQEDFVEASVRDTGQGIPEEDLPKVFGKFEQLGKAPNLEDKGTGLGLAICKGILELHHGEIRCESKYGEGTRFMFKLPKYTAKELFRQAIREEIQWALEHRTELAVIAFHWVNGKEISHLTRDLRRAVEKELRRKADTLIEDEHSLLVILPDTSRQGAEMVSERMRQRIQDYLASQGLADQMPFESRIASLPQDGGTAEDLFKKVCSPK